MELMNDKPYRIAIFHFQYVSVCAWVFIQCILDISQAYLNKDLMHQTCYLLRQWISERIKMQNFT